MAETTIGTYLGYRTSGQTGSTYTKACDIIDYPDLVDPAERIETTTLSDPARTYKKGLGNTSEKVFTANYDKGNYKTLQSLDGEYEWCVLFEESGSVITFSGESQVSIAGGGVGEARKMNLAIFPSTVPTLSSQTGSISGNNITLKD